MSSINTISTDKLERLVGTPKCPVIIDVRTGDELLRDPRLIPGSIQRSEADVAAQAPPQWGAGAFVVVCRDGAAASQSAAARLRHSGWAADALDGGFEAWQRAGLPLISTEHLPARDGAGRTVWVTRERPKIDRIACPWLIRRFVDPAAVFLFVAPALVEAVADRIDAAPFDIEGVFWSHRGDRCTFDTMIEEFGLASEPLARLAAMVRGADTARMDLSPEAPGLLAVSLGLSRMFADDREQLEAGMLVYDALYRWCRDATGETHDWVPNPARSKKGRAGESKQRVVP